jgi:hypothetical protein
MFSLEGGGGAAAKFGTAVHALLAKIEWGNTAEPDSWETPGVPDTAVAEAVACLQARALAPVWAHVERGEVWRERSFEIVLDEAWVTGVFDRVVVTRDERGRATAATVYDFKTDRIVQGTPAVLAEVIERHSAQLNLYRRVAAACTGLPTASIRCELVFTHGPLSVVVPSA